MGIISVWLTRKMQSSLLNLSCQVSLFSLPSHDFNRTLFWLELQLITVIIHSCLSHLIRVTRHGKSLVSLDWCQGFVCFGYALDMRHEVRCLSTMNTTAGGWFFLRELRLFSSPLLFLRELNPKWRRIQSLCSCWWSFLLVIVVEQQEGN